MRKPNQHYKRVRRWPTPLRIGIGVLMVIGGLFGFLPVLGFWMVPLGLLVILIDVPMVKRFSSRLRKAWRALRRERSGGRERERHDAQ